MRDVRLRTALVAVVMILMLMLVLAPPVWAQEKAAGHDGHDGQGDDGGIFGWAVDLGVWSLVVFLLLYFILKKYAWGPMLDALRKREDTIRNAIEEAKLARAETERVRAEFKAEMDKAYAEIPKLLDEARRDAQQLAEEMRAKAQADVQADRQRLRREIETAKDQALKELQDFAANLATRISAKVLRRAVTLDDHRRLVDEALAEMQQVRKGA